MLLSTWPFIIIIIIVGIHTYYKIAQTSLVRLINTRKLSDCLADRHTRVRANTHLRYSIFLE